MVVGPLNIGKIRQAGSEADRGDGFAPCRPLAGAVGDGQGVGDSVLVLRMATCWARLSVGRDVRQEGWGHSTQSAMKMLVSRVPPLLRLLQKTMRRPSGLNMGKASKPLSRLTLVSWLPSPLTV